MSEGPCPRRALTGAATAAALALACAVASGAPVEKAPDPLSGATGHVSNAFGTPAAGAPRLIITFADAPARAEATRRMRGLGTLTPLVPEAGVWRLMPAGGDVRARAAARPRVVGAEWSLQRTVDETPAPPLPLTPVAPPTDAFFTAGAQWSLLGRGGPAWSADLGTAGPRPRIAILDSGVSVGHEEWGGAASPLVAPRNVLRKNADADDWGHTGHGTHVAGVAAAPANGLGIVGVSPADPANAQIIPVRIADPEGRSTDDGMMAGIRWAVTHGAKVVNISAGGPGFSRAFQETILWATQRGAIVVASVGNDGDTGSARTVNYPAGYRRVLGVAAQCDGRASADCATPFGVARFSNRNASVDITAPGVGILSTVPTRVVTGAAAPGYAVKDGTSMAAPYVAGVAALVQGANGNALSPYQVMRQIALTARPLEGGARNNRSGYGVIDPVSAVTRTAPADDLDEVNDDIKWLGAAPARRTGSPTRIEASIDQQEDIDDVYPMRLRKGDRVTVTLRYATGVEDLYVWGAGTRTVRTDAANVRRNLLRFKGGGARTKRAVIVATRTGVHYVNVYGRRGRGDYTLTILNRSR